MFEEVEALTNLLEAQSSQLSSAVEDENAEDALTALTKIQVTIKSLVTELRGLPTTADVGEPV